MESKAITKLLQKYDAGETSIQEEIQLRQYFSATDQIPLKWMSYRAFFGYYSEAPKESFPEQRTTKSIAFQPWMAVAAMVAIVLTVFLTRMENQNTITNSNPEDLDLAFEQFQTNIKWVSNHLNKGTEQIAYLEYWNTTTQILIK